MKATKASRVSLLSDRRLIQGLIGVAAIFSFTSTIHLARLQHHEEQDSTGQHIQNNLKLVRRRQNHPQHHQHHDGTADDSRSSSTSTSRSTSHVASPSVPVLSANRPTVDSRQVKRQPQRPQQHRSTNVRRQQASLQEWLSHDPYLIHNNNNRNNKNNNDRTSQMNVRDENGRDGGHIDKDGHYEDDDNDDDDPVEHYRTIFCPAVNDDAASSFKDDPRRDQKTGRRKPVILWGIPSTVSESEVMRRQVLRSTYLNYYTLLETISNGHHNMVPESTTLSPVDRNLTIDAKNRHEIPSTDSSTSNLVYRNRQQQNRICSFHEWTCNHTAVVDDCQIVYVFFVGAGNSETAPSEIVELEEHDVDGGYGEEGRNAKNTNFRSMLFTGDHVQPLDVNGKNVPRWTANSTTISQQHANASPPPPAWISIDKHEPGVVYLKIRENQFDGKMTTWFQFASLVDKEYKNKIDYVAKVDSDLLLFTPNFLEWIETEHDRLVGTEQNDPSTATLPPRPRRTYGGIEFPATNCELNATLDHDCPLPLVGRSYMSGELNFMSIDLARYIVSKDCPRASLTIPHEDVSLSNYVYSYQNNTKYHERVQGSSQEGVFFSNYTIRVMSVEEKNIMLTKSATADWRKFDIQTTERFLDLVWGHSIKRGKYTQYLVFKRDNSFVNIWSMFLRRYLPLLGLTLPLQLQPKMRQQTAGTGAARVPNTTARLQKKTTTTTSTTGMTMK